MLPQNGLRCLVWLVILAVTASYPVTLVDLSYEFSDKTPTFPTHKRFESIGFKHVYPNPESKTTKFAIQDFTGSEHAGTHIDAPLHFKDGAKTIEQIPIEKFTGPAVVIDIKERARQKANSVVTVQDLQDWENVHGRIPENAYVLMNSGWDEFWQDEKKFLGNDRRDATDLHYPGFSKEACQWLVDNRNVNALGVDTAGLDVGNSLTYGCHYILSEHEVIIVENVFNLDELPPKGATLRSYPMKIKGGTGAPTRIIATIGGDSSRPTRASNEL